MMHPVYVYDGSFDGLLSAIVQGYRRKEVPVVVPRAAHAPGLFAQPLAIATDPEESERLAEGLRQRGAGGVLDTLYRAFLSEDPAAPEAIHGHVRAVMEGGRDATTNPLAEATWTVERLAKRTGREVHRMHAFVRFERAEGGVYAATVEPVCDVLPLVGDFFQARFASQPWAIYDARRGYGLYYDLATVRVVDAVLLADAPTPTESSQAEPAPEERYQTLWRTYFEAVDIPERRNLKLQLRHMPKRYWKHLTEVRP